MQLSVNGITLNVEQSGAGRPLLLLHGFTGSAATWTPFAEYFAPHFHTISPDLIGHGRSDSPPDAARYSMVHCVADLLALLDLGYRTDGVYSVNVRGDNDRLIAPATDALSADPRIGTVALTSGNPMFVTRAVAAAPAGDRAPVPVRYTFVSPEFFTVLDLSVVRGRPFLPQEARSSARVAIVSEAMARAFWPGADPIGQTLRIERPTSSRLDELDGYGRVTVVGLVRDVVSGMMAEGADAAHVYLPASAADPHVIAALIRPPVPAMAEAKV